MSKSSASPTESTDPAADERALTTIAEGLAGHRALLYGFGTILVISATCQILRTDFALYLWIVFAIYLVGSLIWLVTRDQPAPHKESKESTVVGSNTVVTIDGSKRIGDVANGMNLAGNKEVTIRDSEDIGDVANDTGR